MTGILRQVSDDFVLIDSKWFKVLDPKYIPQTTNCVVEYEVSSTDSGVITFIKEAKNQAPSKDKPKIEPKKETRGETSKQIEVGRDTSIIRQVLFKGAVELVIAGKYPTVQVALEDLKHLESFLLGKN